MSAPRAPLYAATVSDRSHAIAAAIERVQALRRERAADPRLAARVRAVKAHQQARFARDYTSLAADSRYAPAVGFFLAELYGPADFEQRDADFARIAPRIAHVLPRELVQTVQSLATLHRLTEELDHEMALALASDQLDERSYRHAWSLVGRRADRETQLALLLSVGEALDAHTRGPLLSATLRLMRAPARAAGLSELQAFLENGLAAFAHMRGASDFLAAIALNERRMLASHFDSEK
jgi:hypothetical protein